VKLLFDENLSPRLVRLLAVVYPGSVHVRDVGLKGHVDDGLWQYARYSGLVIVSKDTDFRERSYVEGFPPKVIWLDVGNAGTQAVAQLLTAEHDRANQFEADHEASMLILSLSKDAV
jgi:predicted nuclease of predicted toxin-antitoxin system